MSLLTGFETIKQLIPGDSMQRMSRHCFNLAKYLYESLKELKHSNGRSVVHFYHDTAFESISNQGGIVNFNILHDDGSYVGYSQVNLHNIWFASNYAYVKSNIYIFAYVVKVARVAQLNNIYLRAGCFCNPGACQRHFKLSDDYLVVLLEVSVLYLFCFKKIMETMRK